MNLEHNLTGLEIAVIGMAGKFPKANNIQKFWEQLKNGQEGITFFTDEELLDSGVHPKWLNHPDYVKAKAILEDIEYFDASFFGYTPADAKIIDPQNRFFLELSWEALEDAGYDPHSYPGLIGAFAGASESVLWKAKNLYNFFTSEGGDFSGFLLNNKDYISLLGAYKLNLRGPCFTLYTACSTGLVSVHQACQAVLNGECDMALAGAVRISLPQKDGYIYEKGMIRSPDGHCRAFDANAAGFARGSGAGIVLLKRLEDAMEDGDHIYAVVKGSAVNNDGYRKVGFTAPSIEGQTEVIRLAHQMAQVEPESITYVEAHGTGTRLGDPVEVEALTTAFNTDKRQYCALGSIKTNIGHLDAASGISGFFKTVLALKNKQIPPIVNFVTPNPKIDFENSPFYINTDLIEWKRGEYPLRAGLSSLGIGGTNVHIVLEEAPEFRSDPDTSPYKLVLLSARTPTALETASANMAAFFKKNPGINFADAAYTLQVGRKQFAYRRMAICPDITAAENILTHTGSPDVRTAYVGEENKSAIFMFPGLGAQYVNMGLELYQTQGVFRTEMDRCFDILINRWDIDLKERLYPSEQKSQTGEEETAFQRMDILQTAVYVVGYALARQLTAWGIEPRAMIGYSFGEYTAATIAGVISPEDALRVLVKRGQLIDRLPPGAMLSVPAARETIEPMLDENLDIAIDNGISCIVAGPKEQVERFEKKMKEHRYLCYHLSAMHGIHSSQMEDITDEFEAIMRKVPLNAPKIPYISNVTGTWATEENVTDPDYWAQHLRQTVRFAEGIEVLTQEDNPVFIEIGPGHDLTTMLGRYLVNRENRENQEKRDNHQVFNLIKPKEHSKDQNRSDLKLLLKRLGQLWLAGIEIDWSAYYGEEKRQRISLPTYPFERQRFWLDVNPFKSGKGNAARASGPYRRLKSADWFYNHTWVRSKPLNTGDTETKSRHWLVFQDQNGLGAALSERLRQQNQEVADVTIGDGFSQTGPHSYSLSPGNPDDYTALFNRLVNAGKQPQRMVLFWGFSADAEPLENQMESHRSYGFDTLGHLARSIDSSLPNQTEPIHIKVITSGLHSVTGEECLFPGKALLSELMKQTAKPHVNIRLHSIDIIPPQPDTSREKVLLDQLSAECLKDSLNDSPAPEVAYRGLHRWQPDIKQESFGTPDRQNKRLKKNGVYMIAGWQRGPGLGIAKYLGLTVAPKLVLIDDRSFPAREQWDYYREDDNIGHIIRTFQNLELHNVQLLFLQNDLSDTQQQKEAVAAALEKFGTIDGVIHLGTPCQEETGANLQRREKELLATDEAVSEQPLDFFISLSPVEYGYCMAHGEPTGYKPWNTAADTWAYDRQSRGTFAVSVAWGDRTAGGIPEAEKIVEITKIASQDIAASLARILANNAAAVTVSPVAPGEIIEFMANAKKEDRTAGGTSSTSHKAIPELHQERPLLETVYAPPTNDIEEKLLRIWQIIFGLKQVGIDDNFFELGGDSIKAVNTVNMIEKTFGTEISLNEFFKRSTIRKIAANIETDRGPYVQIERAKEKSHYRISPVQKILYVLQQQQGWQYHTLGAVELNGELQRPLLEQAFRQLIQRHESLRTGFEEIEGKPVQRIHPEVDFKIREYDESETGIKEILENFTAAFDLTRPPLFRTAAVKRGPGRYVLLTNTLWLITDGQSRDIVIEELGALLQGRQLPEVHYQYKDFSQWQNSEKGREALEKQEALWRETFADHMPSMPMLPFDNRDPEYHRFEERSVQLRFDKAETEALRAVALKEESTMYMVIYSIFSVMLARVCNQDEIFVTTNLIGRRHEEFKRVIGRFVNTLAIVTEPKSELSLIQYLRQVRETILEVFENQEYVLEDIYRKIAEKEGGYRNPIYGVMYRFNNRTTPQDAPEPTNINEILYKDTGTAAAKNVNATGSELALNGTETGDGIRLSFNYNINLFREETIHKFIRVFRTIADGLVSDKNQKIADIEIHAE
jgi:acyl transferase domain-containing protein/acyl carrier protein